MDTVLIAYIPALHQGYINFFKKYPNILYILGNDFVREHPRMERDIRAITPEDMKRAVEALGIFKKVEILTKENISDIKDQVSIVMPDEDVSHTFVEKNLSSSPVQFENVFLRWDGHNAQKKNASVSPDHVVTQEAFDREMMGKAYDEAKRSSDWWRNIGALAVKDGKILFSGHNHPLPSDQTHNVFGDPRSNFDYGVSFELSKFLHAEAGIIAEAAKRGVSLDGASLYVTTFPCPVCAKSVATAGIKKVYYKEGYSLLDAEDILKGYGIEIVRVE